MAKISQEQRDTYQDKIKLYKKKIEDNSAITKKLKIKASQSKDDKSMINLQIVNNYLQEINLYCGMNEVSIDFMEVKNTAFLEKARQLIYEVIMLMENIVTKYIDVPFSEYAENLSKISQLSDIDRLNLIKKMSYSFNLVEKSFGENSKWKWSFIEIEARLSVITKNIFDFKRYQRLDDPREEGFKERRKLVSIMQKTLDSSSQGYRQKYELSTKDIEDLKKAIDLQKALLRVSNILGDTAKVDKLKKQIDVWNTLLEKHLAEIELKKKGNK